MEDKTKREEAEKEELISGIERREGGKTNKEAAERGTRREKRRMGSER